MLLPMRRLLVPVFAISMMVGGLAYAAGDTAPPTEIAPPSETTEQPLDTGNDVLDTDAEPSEEAEDDATGPLQATSTARSTEGCADGFTGNHGQFVSSTEDRPRRDAAHSPCGKPLREVEEEETDEPSTDAVEPEDDEDHGLKKGHDKDESKKDR